MGEVDARILAKVVEYCKYHHLSDRPTEEVERWEKEFVSVDKSTLFQLILVRSMLSMNVPIPLPTIVTRTATWTAAGEVVLSVAC